MSTTNLLDWRKPPPEQPESEPLDVLKGPPLAAYLVRLIRARHDDRGRMEWGVFTELADGTGAMKRRTIDVFAIHLWPSKQFRSAAYEVKIDRADFRRELDDPSKRAPWEKLASECWFVAPAGVIPVEEVPEGWGLLEATKGGKLRRKKAARQHQIESYPPVFVASMARRSCIQEQAEPIEAWSLAGRKLTIAGLLSLARKLGAYRTKRREMLELRELDAQADQRRREIAERHGALLAAVKQRFGWDVTGENLDERAGSALLKINQRYLLERAHKALGEALGLDPAAPTE